MSIFQHYYQFKHLKGAKAKCRMICTASTGDYQPLENLRTQKERKEVEPHIKANGKGYTNGFDANHVGGLVLDLGMSFGMKMGIDAERKPSLIFKKSSNKYLSGVYGTYKPLPSNVFPEYDDKTFFGFGDMRGTKDALFFILHDVEYTEGRLKDGATLEVYVAKNYSRNSINLWQAARNKINMQIWQEVKELRAKAKAESYD